MLNRKRTATVATRSSTKESRIPNIRTTPPPPPPPHTRSLVLTFLAAISAAASLTTASRLALVAAAAVFTALAAGCSGSGTAEFEVEQQDGQITATGSATAEVEQQQDGQPAAAEVEQINEELEDRLDSIDLSDDAKDALREIRNLAKEAADTFENLHDRAEDDDDINNRDPIFDSISNWIERSKNIADLADNPTSCIDTGNRLGSLIGERSNGLARESRRSAESNQYPSYIASNYSGVAEIWDDMESQLYTFVNGESCEAERAAIAAAEAAAAAAEERAKVALDDLIIKKIVEGGNPELAINCDATARAKEIILSDNNTLVPYDISEKHFIWNSGEYVSFNEAETDILDAVQFRLQNGRTGQIEASEGIDKWGLVSKPNGLFLYRVKDILGNNISQIDTGTFLIFRQNVTVSNDHYFGMAIEPLDNGGSDRDYYMVVVPELECLTFSLINTWKWVRGGEIVGWGPNWFYTWRRPR